MRADGIVIELGRGTNLVPALVDIDDDGDLDLFAGESSGDLNFWRNVGSPTAPAFELVSESYEDIDAGRRSTWRAPAIRRWRRAGRPGPRTISAISVEL